DSIGDEFDESTPNGVPPGTPFGRSPDRASATGSPLLARRRRAGTAALLVVNAQVLRLDLRFFFGRQRGGVQRRLTTAAPDHADPAHEQHPGHCAGHVRSPSPRHIWVASNAMPS